MNLSLIYHVNSKTEHLKKSLTSVFNQVDKNFEFILIDDDSTSHVKTILNEFDFKKIKNFKYINSNQKLGRCYSLNVGVQQAKGKFVYYLGSNTLLDKNFTKKINEEIKNNANLDFIIFPTKKTKNQSTIFFEEPEIDLFKLIKISIKDKIFNISFLKKNKIQLNNYQYYPLLYIIRCINCMQKCEYLGEIVATFEENKTFSYNLYDVFEEADILMNTKSEFKIKKEWNDIYEFAVIYSILYTFLHKIDICYGKTTKTGIKLVSKAINSTKTWLSQNIPSWRHNSVIIKNTLNLRKDLIDYLKNFKFSFLYVHGKMKKWK